MTIHFDVSNANDSRLIQLSRKGDSSAYGTLVKRYQSLVCSVAYSRCGDLAMSEDIAQEAFLIAWQKLEDLKEISKFKQWICTIVRNIAHRTRERDARRNPEAVTLDRIAELPAATASPIERVVSKEQEQLVWKALADIPEDYREPMILFYREEQSVARVAESLELSQDAVKQRLSRGRRMVKEHLTSTVEAALRKSKPSKAFTSAVLLGLSATKAEAAIAAGTSGAVAAKVASGVGVGNGLSLLYLSPLLKLPLIAWLFKTALDETRSPREREQTLRHLLFWMMGGFLMVIPMFASIPWANNIEPPWLRGLVIPGLQILFYIPMILSFRRFGKRIERLRVEEGTATPPRPLVEPVVESQAEPRAGHVMLLFFGSGLLLAVWPAILSIVTGEGLLAVVFFTLAIAISLIGSMFCGRFSKYSFQVYGLTLGAITLVCIGMMWWSRPEWDGLSSHFLWFVGTLQALAMSHVVLMTVVWKRVYGKPTEGTDVD